MDSSNPDSISTFEMVATGLSSTRTDVKFRDLSFTIDEPPERGGANMGPTPPEALLAALVGCTNRITHKIAQANGIEIENLSIGLEAAFNRNGVNLKEEIEVPFPSIKLAINMTTSASDTAIEKLKTDLRKFCPVSKIIRRSGTELTEVWTVRRPTGLARVKPDASQLR